ncbi:endonuclease/exonuclease/phosphatase family protein [Arthrobacter sp. ISL-30]|uniref:endonuclease/exonuclease/phosphatase family protein n=1 Tax=Arthrobacter sp. ISL-30 TaxID=2819109 RepID=UPI001BE8160B|nr:endonuclease/exonuclease/phosphatase family protein [Arthrobacter sp. ISL-30]MBT2513575.1 endonuclease/exonuclease/phosphatase family protein [Arthrobacter sp. ISL-30]
MAVSPLTCQLLAIALLVPVASVSFFRAVLTQWPTPVVQLLSFTPWMVVPAVFALGLALAGRRAWIMIVAAVLLAAQLLWLFPLDAGRPSAAPSRSSTSLSVMNINSQFGEADAAEIVRLVREERVGLLAVQEHTPALEKRLAAEGLGSVLPNRVSNFARGAGGSALYSLHPMQFVGMVPDTPFEMPRVRLALGDTHPTVTLEVTNIHALPPVEGRIHQWRSDLAALRHLVAEGGQGNRLLIGDFNATYDHSEFRAVLDGGEGGTKLVDVGTAAGLRLLPTWPMEGVPLPGITIDHVVTTQGIAGSRYAVHRIPGSDHAAVLATLSIPSSD